MSNEQVTSEARQHGYAAAGSGAHVSACPYEQGSAACAEWREGFEQYITERKEQHENG